MHSYRAEPSEPSEPFGTWDLVEFIVFMIGHAYRSLNQIKPIVLDSKQRHRYAPKAM